MKERKEKERRERKRREKKDRMDRMGVKKNLKEGSDNRLKNRIRVNEWWLDTSGVRGVEEGLVGIFEKKRKKMKEKLRRK